MSTAARRSVPVVRKLQPVTLCGVAALCPRCLPILRPKVLATTKPKHVQTSAVCTAAAPQRQVARSTRRSSVMFRGFSEMGVSWMLFLGAVGASLRPCHLH